MASWKEIESDAPDFAASVLARFEAGANKTLATIRRDGAPRISGTEARFDGGQVVLGMMAGSVKLRDVQRDPRVALHSPTMDAPGSRPQDQAGDAKLAGTLIETESKPGHVTFRLDITEAVFTYIADGRLVMETWHTDRKHQRRNRLA